MRKKVFATLTLFTVAVITFAGCGKDIPVPAPTDSDTEDYIMQDGSFDGLALMSDVERAFCEATGKTLYFEEFDAGGEWELHVYTEEDGEEVEWYYIDEQGVITDSAGEVVTLDDFHVRDEVLAGLLGDVSSPGATGTEGTDTADTLSWETNTWTVTDKDGYTIEYEVKYSPFMFYDGENTQLESYWNEIGNSNSLPSHDELHDSLIGTAQVYPKDIYCAVGTISARNVTSGFDFSPDNPYDGAFVLKLNNSATIDNLPRSRVYYANGYKDIDGMNLKSGLLVTPHMESNNWGPVPFIVVLPEEVTPNYPEGHYRAEYENEDYLYFDSYWYAQTLLNGEELSTDLNKLPIIFAD